MAEAQPDDESICSVFLIQGPRTPEVTPPAPHTPKPQIDVVPTVDPGPASADLESHDDHHLYNTTIRKYSWSWCSVLVRERKQKKSKSKTILQNATGAVEAGQMLAIMGPSGSGKTTLLNALAQRCDTDKTQVSGEFLVNGAPPTSQAFRRISSFVEQEDALIGSLTARETIDFAARLAPVKISSRQARRRLVDSLLTAFGLESCANTLIGTPIRRGCSGGQKRRVSVASQLVSAPQILFVDEITSGLDSTASREVMTFMRFVARKYNLIVIASIHQPSTDTFNLFDKLCVLSEGRTCYFGDVSQVKPYFDAWDYPMPPQINPAEFILDLVSTDFQQAFESREDQRARVKRIWDIAEAHPYGMNEKGGRSRMTVHRMYSPRSEMKAVPPHPAYVLLTLLHRSWIKSYRDVFVYGVRLAMYTGLAIMMGTVWLRLGTDQSSIQPFINAIFFGSAFMSFMAVAYVPAFLEDRAVYVKDRANGLYGPSLFMAANFILGVPYLFLFSFVFSLLAYWLTNFSPQGSAFFTWIAFIWLDLITAESLVVLVSSLIPNFVISLAVVAFANGLWMCVGGFLVPLPELNPFWKYVFHYIDYQAYVFQGMMVNEFSRRTYSCGTGCQCMYPTGDLKCQIPGTSVLQAYGYSTGHQGLWAGILIVIIFVYRMLGFAAVYFQKR